MKDFSPKFCIFWIKLFSRKDFPTIFWQPRI